MHYNLWRVLSGKPAASRLRHQWGLDTGKVRGKKPTSLFASLLPLSASLASNSSGFVALFSNCILSLSAAVFEGKGAVLLPVRMSGIPGHVQTFMEQNISATTTLHTLGCLLVLILIHFTC